MDATLSSEDETLGGVLTETRSFGKRNMIALSIRLYERQVAPNRYSKPSLRVVAFFYRVVFAYIITIISPSTVKITSCHFKKRAFSKTPSDGSGFAKKQNFISWPMFRE